MVLCKYRSVDSYCLCMAHTGCCHHNRAATIGPLAAQALCHDNDDAMGSSPPIGTGMGFSQWNVIFKGVQMQVTLSGA